MARSLVRHTLPPNCPGGYAPVFEWRPSALAPLKRTNGPSYGGFYDGVGLLAQGTIEGGTYDTRGVGGQTNDFCPSWDYAWAGGFVNASCDADALTMKAGTCATAGIASTVPYIANDTRYTNYGFCANTWDSLNLKGDHYIEYDLTLNSTFGTWFVIWWLTKARDPFTPYPLLFERDDVEFVPHDAGNRRYLSCGLHGNTATGSGQPYDSFGVSTDTGVTLDSQRRTYWVRRAGDTVAWGVIGIGQIQQLTIPSQYTAKDDWSYMRINWDVGDAAYSSWPGTWAGSPDPVTTLFHGMRIYMRPSQVATNLMVNLGTADSLGADRVAGKGVHDGITPGFWSDSGTSSDGTAVGGLTPKVVASAGGAFNRRYWTGRATTTNNGLNGWNEPGTTPANGGLVSGQRYHAKYTFAYGTSNSAYLNIGIDGGSTLIDGTFTGTTFTPGTGSPSNVTLGTDAFGRSTLDFDFTAGASGDSHISLGPNSTTVGQNITWYDVSVRPYL